MRRAARFAARGLLACVGVAALGLALARGAAAFRERVPREALMPASGRLVKAGDVRLFVQESGPASGPVVVLLHGTGAWSEIWRPVMSTLSEAGYRAIAVDLPPFGFSDRSATADYTPDTQARRLWAALDALGLGNVTLVGHSFGARATVQAALMRPTRIVRLVLVDAALGISDTLPPAAPSAIARAVLGAGPLVDAIVSATITNPWMTRTLTGTLVAFPERLTDTQIAMLQRPLRQPGSTRAASAWLPGFVLAPPPAVLEARRALAAFPAPTHVIWGELDDLTPVRQGEDLAHLVRCGTWDVLPRTGHIPGLESPDALAQTLLVRLRDSSCSGSGLARPTVTATY